MPFALADLLRDRSFRGKARLLDAVTPRRGIREATIVGYRLTLDLADFIQRSIYLGTFEPIESRWVRAYLKPGMTVVDVGANVGYYTFLAASLVGPTGRVYAFEPSPYAFERLAEAVRLNGIPHITAIQSGLGEVRGKVRLFLPEQAGNHTPSMLASGMGRPIDVSVQTLDEYVVNEELNGIDLLKIDVEGFEPQVIRGAQQLLREHKVRAILCEFNTYWLGRNHCSPRELYQTIVDFGFAPLEGPPHFKVSTENVVFVRRNVI